MFRLAGSMVAARFSIACRCRRSAPGLFLTASLVTSSHQRIDVSALRATAERVSFIEGVRSGQYRVCRPTPAASPIAANPLVVVTHFIVLSLDDLSDAVRGFPCGSPSALNAKSVKLAAISLTALANDFSIASSFPEMLRQRLHLLFVFHFCSPVTPCAASPKRNHLSCSGPNS